MRLRIHRHHLVLLSAVLGALAVGRPARADVTLISTGSTYRYLDNGSNQGTTWRSTTFSDASWAQGPAQLGYGDGDEATVVSYGPSASAKYVTTYLRRSFSVANPAAYTGMNLRLLRDDGAVVYLNGVEVYRSNMPAGTIGYATWASSVIGGTSETTFQSSTLASSLLQAGTNVIAIELHQSDAASSDISFDLELVGRTPPASYSVVRGPYLQLGTPSSVIVRWRTNAATDSVVRIGPSAVQLVQAASDLASSTEHQLTLTGLSPGTRYYYAVGSSASMLAGGDDATYFETAPVAGNTGPMRIWVTGDGGTANASARSVYDAYRSWNGSGYTDLWLMLGDNAYTTGTDAEYEAAVFDMYPELLRQTVLWPAYGNHDGGSADSATQSGPYYDIFSLPRNAEAGGVASGTEAYYSYDYGNVHFVVLDSFESSRAPGGAMLTWLQADLAAANADWLISYWHHPPYTKGSHNSDTESELIEMRQNALPILESYGVDLVLAGHSHSYERSFLIDAHYGTSSTLVGSNIVDGGDGQTDGDGAYHKPSASLSPHQGTVYVVAGTSGQASGGTLNHPAMFSSLNVLGSLVLDIEGRTLTGSFLNASGGIADHFTLTKGPGSCTPSEPAEQSCGDGVDNDCDGAADCQDTSCAADPACGPPPRVVTLSAVHDAYVRGSRATTNYGNAADLQLDNGTSRETTYVRPTNLGDIAPGAQVLSAFLVMTVSGSGSAFQVRQVLSDWTETAVTYNTQPSVATTVETTFTPSASGQISVDITALAQSWVDGSPARGVQLYATGSNGVELRSSEYATASARPRFVIEVQE